MSLKKKLISIIFWSILSAAFIGPGTVTAATLAGMQYEFSLLWAFTFSTLACVLLQEASARLTIFSGLGLGEAISKQFEGKKSKPVVLAIVIIAIVLGCAAYEAGNILGSVAGLAMIFDFHNAILVSIVALTTGISLMMRSIQTIAKFLGVIVMMMGIAFVATGISLGPDWLKVIEGSFVPSFPIGSSMLIISLVGTTIVPYDLFLGSGAVDKKQTLSEMRFGLTIAIILGGIISMSIILIGNALTEGMSQADKMTQVLNYSMLRGVLEIYVNEYAVYLFGFGMFAAGFCSAITAPLASAITAKNLFATERNEKKWRPHSIYFKLTAFGVLSVGLFFGYMGVNPVPAIIVAQAFNGLILPLVTVFLIYVVNDENLMTKQHQNGLVSNILLSIILWITLVLGANQIVESIMKALGIGSDYSSFIIPIIVVSFILTCTLLFLVYKAKAKKSPSLDNTAYKLFDR